MQENLNTPNTEHQNEVQLEAVAEELSLPDLSDEAVARINDLEVEVATLKDQYLRSLADLENLRRRSQEDVAAAHKYAINKFLQEMLPVKDSLEMAVQDQSGQFENIKFGVDLTLKQLVAAFEKSQISEINPLGQKLDPHQHAAMSLEESDAEAGTVIRVLQKGYMVAERVLRPAMVVVAKEKS
ncbi:nucleotide exchange factor GrpE [Craterilacuibacter sp.]|uniref:nucleotide exchange factor GrpE n=1 Tax=Craterilacuibacter sp. TaxID=2870909 RepID=UPI003F2E1EAF